MSAFKINSSICVCLEYGNLDLSALGVVSTPLDVTYVKESGKVALVAAPSLLINGNQLEDGVTYKFRLSVNHSDSSSYADIEVNTNSAPSKGLSQRLTLKEKST